MDINEIYATMSAETTYVVKLWMRWMVSIFLLSLVFLKRYKAARWTFIAIIATMICAVITWKLSKNVHLFGIPHLIVWTPLAVYLWKQTLSPRARAAATPDNINKDGLYHKAFMLWAVLIFVTILISLVFDVRDTYLVAIGVK